jgi:hypothetical protein
MMTDTEIWIISNAGLLMQPNGYWNDEYRTRNFEYRSRLPEAFTSAVRFSTQIAKKLQTKGLKVAGKEDTSEKDLQRPEG